MSTNDNSPEAKIWPPSWSHNGNFSMPNGMFPILYLRDDMKILNMQWLKNDCKVLPLKLLMNTLLL